MGAMWPCQGAARRTGGVDGGVGTAGGGDAPLPRTCPGFPLSRERRWGVVGTLSVLVEEGEVPACAGTTGWGGNDGRGGAGRQVLASDGGVRVPLRRDGPFAKGPYDGGLGVSGTATVLRGGVAPPGAPLDTGFRRNDARVGAGMTVRGGGNGGGRRRHLAAHLPWVPAKAGTTVGLGGLVEGVC